MAEVPGGRTLTLEVLLPLATAADPIAAELVARAEEIAAMFAGTPARISFDTLSPRPGEGLADRHTAREIRLVDNPRR